MENSTGLVNMVLKLCETEKIVNELQKKVQDIDKLTEFVILQNQTNIGLQKQIDSLTELIEELKSKQPQMESPYFVTLHSSIPIMDINELRRKELLPMQRYLKEGGQRQHYLGERPPEIYIKQRNQVMKVGYKADEVFKLLGLHYQ